MRIAVNLLPYKNYEGVETYIVNILNHIAREYPEIELVLIKHTHSPAFLNLKGNNISNYIIETKKKSGWYILLLSQTIIYKALMDIDPDFLFCPYPHVPLFYPKTVVTIYDCAYDRFPEESYFAMRVYMKLMFLSIKLFSKKIITISTASKKEIVDLWHISPARIETVYIALPDGFSSYQEEKSLIPQYRLIPKKYFVFVGFARPRKNLEGVLRAFAEFNKRNPNYQLVLIGKQNVRSEFVLRHAEELGIREKIIITGYVSEDQKKSLCKNALAVVFPSFYEGFGLPILEGQSLGVPVLTSDISSMPEIGGDGAYYVDPYSSKSIADGLEVLARNKNIRDGIVKNGYKNKERFSFNKAAQETVRVFRSI